MAGVDEAGTRTASLRPSGLGLIVLAMLLEEPMHVYRMQKLIRDRGKDKVVNVRQRTSLHQTIARLADNGLVEQIEQPETADNYPERRVYAITEEGRRAAVDWLSALITGTPDEFPRFPAALSVLTMVSPETATRLISQRSAAIDAEREAQRSQLSRATVDRVYLLEDEYRIRMLDAEAAWLAEVLTDIRNGALQWTAPPAAE